MKKDKSGEEESKTEREKQKNVGKRKEKTAKKIHSQMHNRGEQNMSFKSTEGPVDLSGNEIQGFLASQFRQIHATSSGKETTSDLECCDSKNNLVAGAEENENDDSSDEDKGRGGKIIDLSRKSSGRMVKNSSLNRSNDSVSAPATPRARRTRRRTRFADQLQDYRALPSKSHSSDIEKSDKDWMSDSDSSTSSEEHHQLFKDLQEAGEYSNKISLTQPLARKPTQLKPQYSFSQKKRNRAQSQSPHTWLIKQRTQLTAPRPSICFDVLKKCQKRKEEEIYEELMSKLKSRNQRKSYHEEDHVYEVWDLKEDIHFSKTSHQFSKETIPEDVDIGSEKTTLGMELDTRRIDPEWAFQKFAGKQLRHGYFGEDLFVIEHIAMPKEGERLAGFDRYARESAHQRYNRLMKEVPAAVKLVKDYIEHAILMKPNESVSDQSSAAFVENLNRSLQESTNALDSRIRGLVASLPHVQEHLFCSTLSGIIYSDMTPVVGSRCLGTINSVDINNPYNCSNVCGSSICSKFRVDLYDPLCPDMSLPLQGFSRAIRATMMSDEKKRSEKLYILEAGKGGYKDPHKLFRKKKRDDEEEGCFESFSPTFQSEESSRRESISDHVHLSDIFLLNSSSCSSNDKQDDFQQSNTGSGNIISKNNNIRNDAVIVDDVDPDNVQRKSVGALNSPFLLNHVLSSFSNEIPYASFKPNTIPMTITNPEIAEKVSVHNCYQRFYRISQRISRLYKNIVDKITDDELRQKIGEDVNVSLPILNILNRDVGEIIEIKCKKKDDGDKSSRDHSYKALTLYNSEINTEKDGRLQKDSQCKAVESEIVRSDDNNISQNSDGKNLNKLYNNNESNRVDNNDNDNKTPQNGENVTQKDTCNNNTENKPNNSAENAAVVTEKKSMQPKARPKIFSRKQQVNSNQKSLDPAITIVEALNRVNTLVNLFSDSNISQLEKRVLLLKADIEKQMILQEKWRQQIHQSFHDPDFEVPDDWKPEFQIQKLHHEFLPLDKFIRTVEDITKKLETNQKDYEQVNAYILKVRAQEQQNIALKVEIDQMEFTLEKLLTTKLGKNLPPLSKTSTRSLISHKMNSSEEENFRI